LALSLLNACRESGCDPAALKQELGDLDRVQSGALAEVVCDHQQREAVLHTPVPSDASDEDLVDSDGIARRGEVLKSDPGRSSSIHCAPAPDTD
jgi:hypothetical protein